MRTARAGEFPGESPRESNDCSRKNSKRCAHDSGPGSDAAAQRNAGSMLRRQLLRRSKQRRKQRAFKPESEPVAQVASPSYPAQSEYQPQQPAGGGKFRAVVLVLLLIIVLGACGGWYFWGVETIIVSSPPDVTVFLDDKELAPVSYGRYVIPHLSRKTHFLKVQRPGFADTIQRLDFPLTSLHEWVNIKLVPSRPMRPSSSR